MKASLLLLPCLVAVLALNSCAGGGGSGPATRTIMIVSSTSGATYAGGFETPVYLRPHESVQWSNGTTQTHSVVWDQQQPPNEAGPGSNIGPFAGGTLSSGWTAPGVLVPTAYPYHCGIHPTETGTIFVVPPKFGQQSH